MVEDKPPKGRGRNGGGGGSGSDHRRHASISLPIPPDILPPAGIQPDSRGRYRVSSGGLLTGGGGGAAAAAASSPRAAAEGIPIIEPHPSRESNIATSRRSYSRGAFWGELPEHYGSYVPASFGGGSRRGSTTGSDGGGEVEGVGGGAAGHGDSSNFPPHDSTIGLGDHRSVISKISISMNKSTNPLTGETLFWGFSKKQWFLLFIFSFADLLAGVTYSLQAPFYPQEAEKKGASPSEYGLVFGVFELAMFIFSPIYGKYMGRIGPRVVFNFGLFVTGTCCLLFGLLDHIQDKWTFLALSFSIRIVEAIGNAGFATATFTIIAIEFPSRVATTFASLETFFGVGLIVGPTLGGGLYQLGGYILPFAVTGGMIFTTAILIAIFMPKSERLAPDGGGGGGGGGLTDSKSVAGYGILTILKIPGVFLATLAIITTAISIGFLSSSLEPHIRQFALSPLHTGLVFVINGGVYAITAPFWGWACDRIQQTKYITLVGSVCLMVGFGLIGPIPLLPLDTTLWLTCAGLFIQGLGLGACFVSSFILALRHSIASGLPDNVATYSVVSGLWSSVLALGLFVGPSVAGVLYDSVGFRWGSMVVVGLGLLLMLILIFFIGCNRKGEADYLRSLQPGSRREEEDEEEEERVRLIGGGGDAESAVDTTEVIEQGKPNYGTIQS